MSPCVDLTTSVTGNRLVRNSLLGVWSGDERLEGTSNRSPSYVTSALTLCPVGIHERPCGSRGLMKSPVLVIYFFSLHLSCLLGPKPSWMMTVALGRYPRVVSASRGCRLQAESVALGRGTSAPCTIGVACRLLLVVTRDIRRRALEADPKNVRAWVKRGSVLCDLGQTEEASAAASWRFVALALAMSFTCSFLIPI